jgi:hypothetical protein
MIIVKTTCPIYSCGSDLMKNLCFDYTHAVAMRPLPLFLLFLLLNSRPGCKQGDYLISKLLIDVHSCSESKTEVPL